MEKPNTWKIVLIFIAIGTSAGLLGENISVLILLGTVIAIFIYLAITKPHRYNIKKTHTKRTKSKLVYKEQKQTKIEVKPRKSSNTYNGGKSIWDDYESVTDKNEK